MDITDLQGTVTLSNKVEMPYFGLGVFQSEEGEEVMNAVKWAIEAGYRHVDTAALYRNEKGVGQAIRESGIDRKEMFVTSKVWNSDQGYDQTLKAFDTSMNKLGFDYLDLYLVHWPVSGKYKDTWKALEKLYKDGKVRAIGVSNFMQHHLEDLMQDAEIMPMVNQVEFHPRLVQQELVDFCLKNNIRHEAWSPLMQGKVLDLPQIKAIAEKYGKSTAQVILRWDLQKGVITIPKSVHKERIVSNADIFDFSLTDEEMKTLDSLDKGERNGPDPNNFDF
ncbi:aldo/keto reductase [Prolixibacter denitrificans]|uniref:Diketogulonate reductase-like aldo/keto reductase n=1 Tax=Prolixibacter denitrificans TaxID=1541063 RepID=A0A2P8CKN5_9BACT|nr:aldo/keto reductase [Prolixibacter denitrificans]PSK85520.1 diketogulonate reductase-like aldo/keto reductase [Prolixibacter denitrificans]GET20142.1 oxidoreductase [Prolixibacter denitrificans]